jgi:apolipoprotein N-acyltransferase
MVTIHAMSNPTRIRLLVLAVLSALLSTLALPNELATYGNPVLGFVCLVPLFAALRESRSNRFSAILGAVFGGVSHSTASYWLAYFHDYAFWTLGTTTLAYMLVYAIVGWYLGFFLRLGHERGSLGGAYRPVAVAAAWTAWEFLKSYGFLGYPWGLIAYAESPVLPLIQIVDRFGVYGVTFLLALANAAVFETLPFLGRWRFRAREETPNRPTTLAPRFRAFPEARVLPASALGAIWGFFAILAAASLCYGFSVLAKPEKEAKSVRAVLVQQDRDSWTVDSPGEAITAMRISQDLARRGIAKLASPPDLVIWSETTLLRPYTNRDGAPDSYFSVNPPGDSLRSFLRETGASLITGAPEILNYETWDATNSVILVSPEGRLLDSYAKIHLVPFAEVIPLWEYGWFRDFMSKAVGLGGGWIPGTRYTVFKAPLRAGGEFSFGAPICFEDAFPDVCRRFVLEGADALVNLTNDSWSQTVSAETQHFVSARFRAIENRTTLVRSTNAGLTCVVDPEGRILGSLPFFTPDSLPVSIPVYGRKGFTAYTILGDWLPFAFILILIGDMIRLRFTSSKPRRRAA